MTKLTAEERLDLIEQQVLPILDTIWEEEQDEAKCILPDAICVQLGLPLQAGVPNQTYDMLRNELLIARPDSEVFSTPSVSTVETTQKKFAHDPPLTSISKASHQDPEVQKGQLFDWINRCVQSTPHGKLHKKEGASVIGERNGIFVAVPQDFLYQAYKLDGLAIALYYEKGKLVRAGLRPRDGINGEDVTEQVKYVKSIPQELKVPLTCSARGELICKLSDFKEVQAALAAEGEDLRANPRNHASGGIRQFKEPSNVKKMKLTFIAYTIEGIDNPPWKTEIERAKYCNQKLGLPFVRVEFFKYEDLARLEELAKTLDYQTDGIIIGVNDLSLQEDMGRHGDQPTGNPRGKIAWKFEEERATPKIKELAWQTGRAGSITPVAEFDAVPLAGTQVRRATLHNLGFIIRNKIGVGTVLSVIKAGNIIPKAIGVVSGQVSKPQYPDVCPSCGEKTHVVHTPGRNGSEDMWELLCNNKSNCPAQNVGTLLHYLKIFGVLGLGESKIAQLIEGNFLKRPSDFYILTEKNCIDAGMSERQALLALASVHMVSSPEKVKDNDKLRQVIQKTARNKKSIPLWKLFASFGIETAGRSCGKALADHFNGDFSSIRNASAEDLAKVKDVGEKTAIIVEQYLADHSEDIDELLKYVEPEAPKTGPLLGLTFVFTGGFPEGKKHWENEVEQRGGKTSSSVSKSSTNFVVVGTDAGEKEEKAKKYGIPTLSLEQLKKDHLK